MERCEIRVRGQVQGVGFRPFVWRLAQARGLAGWVRNDAEGVLIGLWGPAEDFLRALREERPPLARIDAVEVRALPPAPAPAGFAIAPSGAAGAQTRVAPDAATCEDCRAETFAPGQRHRYPFTNCTHCGPRFSILQGLPYDRARTTMAPFAMCPACRAQYEDPGDRRFHAQPIACPACGPRAWLERGGAEVPGEAAVLAGAALAAGEIVAIKGLGGFHLACDATDPAALARLRARKRRPRKPFALMGTPEMIAAHCEVDAGALALLQSPDAPIVLMARGARALPDLVAPGQPALGWMLPATPLHHLILAAAGRPLVMTSGNLSGAPQVIGNAEAREALGTFADAFVMHDREIARRLDDSVLRAAPRMVLRHARGRAPGALALPGGFGGAAQILATGGQMKGAICLVKDGQALLSHHLGDLDDALCLAEFGKALADYAALFAHRPGAVAIDPHPGYRAAAAGRAIARAGGLALVEVDHHHAHLAACLAENGWPRGGGPVAGIVLDGTGLGPDGTLWGGELLLGDYAGARRAAHLRPAPLPGGEMAAREPWRNALMRLDQAGAGAAARRLFAPHPLEALRAAAAAGLNAPPSSSAGRLFDAAAAVLGLAPARQSFEGEAAMALEAAALAAGSGAGPALPPAPPGPQIDPAPMIAALAAWGGPPGPAALAFHDWLAAEFAGRARALVASGAARAVALSGGCLQNAVLHGRLLARLEGLPVLVHRETPANDGGLALGQALVAAARGAETL